MATKRKTPKMFNAFTKSYRLRYVVHAAEGGAEQTLCGRAVDKLSNAAFDETEDGSCKKCIQKLEVERRIHPGYEE